ncbi:MAG: hypothetical protein H7256_04105 [Bdellovibrio sp.]|nr:hypothetical protein [Bdellovibrio sp.]
MKRSVGKWLQDFYFKNHIFRKPQLNYFRVIFTIVPVVLLAAGYIYFEQKKQIEIVKNRKVLFENRNPNIEITKTIFFDELSKKGKAKVTLVENNSNISAVFESSKIEPGTYIIYLMDTCENMTTRTSKKNIITLDKRKIISFKTYSGDMATGDSSSSISLLSDKPETLHVNAVAIYNVRPFGRVVACKAIQAQ